MIVLIPAYILHKQTTITDLINLMKDKLVGKNFNKIIVTDINGKPNVITFYSTASAILQQFYQQQRNEDTEKEKLKLVEAAVKIIKDDIKSLSTSNKTYQCNLFVLG